MQLDHFLQETIVKLGHYVYRQSSKGDMNPIDYFCCEKTNDGVSTR